MAATITLQNTLNWAGPFLRYMPMNAGVGNEPALTCANTILQTIVGAPFAWSWNRASVTYIIPAGDQDATVSVPNFGFIEKASVCLPGAAIPNIFELDVDDLLSETSEQSRPDRIAVQMDDDNGSITFRTFPVADAEYQITVTYQKSAPLFTSLSQIWSPIPDRYNYVVNYGFLALMQMYADDPRYQITNTKFVHALLAAAEGVEETDKVRFEKSWLGNASQLSTLKGQIGIQARQS